MVASLQPAVVLLQVGSNDLRQLDKSVQEIEQKLIGLVLTLKYCYNVQRVAVFADFTLNYFKEDRVEGVEFWRHSGFRSPENQELVYTDDEVHLNEVHVHGYTK